MLAPNKNVKRVLLTGGAGVVGQALIPVLQASGVELTCLMRNRPIANIPPTRQLKGDLRAPRLGLAQDEFAALSHQIDAVIHSAAITNFEKSEDEINDTNVEGTKHILQFCQEAKAQLIYISTAFVYRRELPQHLQEYSAYCDSKRQAEALIMQSGLDWKIVRPSIVVGDSQTGSISTFQGIHNVIAAIMHRFAPMIPVTKQAFIDYVPQDILAKVVESLITVGHPQREHWITAGSNALTANQVWKVLNGFSDHCNCSKSMPKLVDPEVIDRLFRPVFLPSLPTFMRKRMEMLINYACYFNLNESFPSTYANLVKDLKLPQMPCGKEVLWNNLNYWAESTKFLEKSA